MRSYGSLTNPHLMGHYIEIHEPTLRELFRFLMNFVEVDERWYREMNQDVDDAIRAGDLPSAKAHYIIAGYFEDRLPRFIQVDEDWYLQTYPDVAEAISGGNIASAQEHFIMAGFREGRSPHAGWSLINLRYSEELFVDFTEQTNVDFTETE